jgi:hypothetical protein
MSEQKLSHLVEEVDRLIRSEGDPGGKPDAIRRKLSVP